MGHPGHDDDGDDGDDADGPHLRSCWSPR